MRTTSRVLRLATATAAVAILASGPSVRADPSNNLQGSLSDTEGPLVRARIQIGFQLGYPLHPRVDLVQSGAPADQAQRVRVRIRRSGAPRDGISIDGFAAGALVADRVYDVVVRSSGQTCAVLPAAFTARAPAVSIDVSSAARGETVGATVDFASGTPRFEIGTRPARVVAAFGAGRFKIQVPPDLPPGVAEADVAVTTARTRIAASRPLRIVVKRGELSAVVDGVRVGFGGQSYFTSQRILGSYRPPAKPAPQVYVVGARERRFGLETAEEALTLRAPIDLATAVLPVTLTAADGVEVEWTSYGVTGADGVEHRRLAGPLGPFRSTTDVAFTLESIEGSRIRGTFSAHLVEYDPLQQTSDGREFDITDGRFEVDPQ